MLGCICATVRKQRSRVVQDAADLNEAIPLRLHIDVVLYDHQGGYEGSAGGDKIMNIKCAKCMEEPAP